MNINFILPTVHKGNNAFYNENTAGADALVEATS